ncbi:ATP-dependent DNA helicase RecG [Actinomyces ruminicola]|uniref:ATP-dependent DNA helicase RecG n=1 Tax=Actinomyces ruminicola TaxID=332524 RepID=A0A1H0A9D7_9ACTO|nr:ATP-dependent DNA helicase RecG [Actinomyces ruminicola]
MRLSLAYTEVVTDEELQKHVARIRRLGADDARVEAKAAVRDIPKGIWDSVAAFANTEGGLIILGLDESRNFAPADGFDASRIENALIAGLDDAERANPKVRPVPQYQVDRAEVDGAQVVWVRIEPLSATPDRTAPCHVVAQGLERGSYKRVGDADKHLTTYEVHLLRTRNVNEHADRRPVDGRTFADLDPDLVSRTVERVRASGSRALAGLAPDDHLSALQRLNALTADGTPTLAGYLALGTYPQQEYPQLTIDVTVHPGTAKSQDPSIRFLDRRNCDGPLPQAIHDAVHTVMRNLRTRRIVEGTRGTDIPEIPEDVLREAIANAVMHRDYSRFVTGQQVAVNVYPDRVEVINPGGFWGDRTKENVTDGHSASRNEDLARLLTVVPMPDNRSTVCENQGSGVVRMVNEMRAHGLPTPDYSTSTIDHVVVRLDRFGLMDPETEEWLGTLPGRAGFSRNHEAALALARRNGTVSVVDLRDNLGLDSDDCRGVLAQLVADGLLVGMNDGPYAIADQTRSAEATGAEWEILAVLSADEALSIRDVARATGKTLTALRPVLRELVERGLVVATAPPTSRSRKYLLAGG